MSLEEKLRTMVREELELVMRSEFQNLFREGGAKLVGMVDHRQKKYLSTREAADILQVTPTTVREWIRNGKLSAGSAGTRLYRVDVEDLKAFVKRGGDRRRLTPVSDAEIDGLANAVLLSGRRRS